MLHGLHAKLYKGMKMLLIGAVNAKWKVYCLKSFESIPKNTSEVFKIWQYSESIAIKTW